MPKHRTRSSDRNKGWSITKLLENREIKWQGINNGSMTNKHKSLSISCQKWQEQAYFLMKGHAVGNADL